MIEEKFSKYSAEAYIGGVNFLKKPKKSLSVSCFDEEELRKVNSYESIQNLEKLVIADSKLDYLHLDGKHFPKLRKIHLTSANVKHAIFENFRDIEIDIFSSEFGYFSIHHCRLKKLTLMANKITKEFTISQNRIKELKIRGGEYYSGTIYGSFKNKTKLIPHISKLVIEGKYVSSSLEISHLKKIDELEIRGLSLHNSNIDISEVVFSQKSKVRIYKSNLEDVKLYDWDASLIGKFEIGRSILLGMKYSSFSWPKKLSLAVNNFPDTEKVSNQKHYMMLADVYRQLKAVSQSNMDQSQALKFYSLEMTNYLLGLGNRNFSGDVILLTFNKWTNSFGLSWVRAIVFYVFCLILFFLVSLHLGYRADSSSFLLEIIKFMNILDFRVFNDQTPSVTLLLLSWKISSSYLIFQIISAFRKYSKRF